MSVSLSSVMMCFVVRTSTLIHVLHCLPLKLDNLLTPYCISQITHGAMWLPARLLANVLCVVHAGTTILAHVNGTDVSMYMCMHKEELRAVLLVYR